MSNRELSPGALVAERYRIVSLLGRGSSGETYAAEPAAGGSPIALKRFCLKGAESWKALELFEREARILRGIAHPAVPRYVDAFDVETTEGLELFLAQDLVAGVSLAQWVASGGRADEAEVRRIATEVLEVLRHLHSQTPPVLHRDLKPANLMRSPDGRIMVVDFGSVREAATDTAGGSTVAGTYGFMAPEQLRGVALPASDLHALGATLVFLLTQKTLDQLPQKRLRVDLPRDLGVSPALRAWLERMILPAPEDRFPSAHLALAGLKAPAAAPSSGRAKLLAGILGVVTVAGAGGAYALQRLLPVAGEPGSPNDASTSSSAAGAAAPFPLLPELPRSRYPGMRLHKRVRAHASAVFAIQFSTDGKRLVSASHDRTARIFDTATFEPILTLPDHGAPVFGVAFLADQRSVLTAAGSLVTRWDATTGAKLGSVDAGVRVGALAVTPAGDQIWVAGWDGRVRSYRLPSLEAGPTLDASPDKGRVIAVTFTPDGKYLGAAGDDGHLRFFAPPDTKLLRDVPAHAGATNKLRFNAEGNLFASAGDDGAMRLFPVESNKPIASFRASQTEAWEATFSPRSDLLITGDKAGVLSAWRLPGTNLAWRTRVHESRGIIEMQSSRDGRWLALALGNGAIDVYAVPAADDAATVPDPKPVRVPRPEPTTPAEKARRIIDQRALDPTVRLAEASGLAAKAVEANPKDALALVQLGRLARTRGYISGSRYRPAAIEEAQMWSKRALEAKPDLYEAKELAAWLALTEATNREDKPQRRDFDRARAAADALLEADPNRLEGEVLHASIANAEGSHETAVLRATKLVQHADDDRLIALGYGELVEGLTKLGRLDAADAAHKKHIAFSSTSPWDRGNYARFLLRRGLREEAIQMAKDALLLMDYPAAHHTIADALVDGGIQQLWDRGNVEEARKYFNAALEHEAGSADARYGLLACDAHDATQRNQPCTTCEVGLTQLLALDAKHEQALWVQQQLAAAKR